MELSTIQTTAARLMSKAMAMPTPPPVPLARKRSWTEMTHARVPTVTYIPTAPPASLPLKKTKCTLGSSGFYLENEHDALSSMDALSADAEQFLADDPFDFESLPHPVLKRQQAVVHNVCDYPFANSDSADEMAGESLGYRSIATTPLPSRWNLSVVGSSLMKVVRTPSATLHSRRM